MRVFVINLDRRTDRLQQITADLIGHGIIFERISALDSKVNRIVQKSRRPLLAQLMGSGSYSDAFIANYLSNRLIWQKMVDENIEQALILEDDAKIVNWNPAFLDIKLKQLGLDVLRLGANIEPNKSQTSLLMSMDKSIEGRQLFKGTLWGNFATVITLEAATKFLKAKKYWFPSDHYHTFERCFGIRHAIVNPLVWRATDSCSDIHADRKELRTAQTWILMFTKPFRKHVIYPSICIFLKVALFLNLRVV